MLRAWFARADAPPWYRAHTDPAVGRALQLLHHNPAHPWTVGELASQVGLSRAALARRFTELVGEPPMTYLTGWRLALAADLLREPGSTLGAVADEVGYSSPFALSTAFKRQRGMSRSSTAPPCEVDEDDVEDAGAAGVERGASLGLAHRRQQPAQCEGGELG